MKARQIIIVSPSFLSKYALFVMLLLCSIWSQLLPGSTAADGITAHRTRAPTDTRTKQPCTRQSTKRAGLVKVVGRENTCEIRLMIRHSLRQSQIHIESRASVTGIAVQKIKKKSQN
jgi:hypothetical protein